MTTVAVTGAGGFTAAALLERLNAERAIERTIGVDGVEPLGTAAAGGMLALRGWAGHGVGRAQLRQNEDGS